MKETFLTGIRLLRWVASFPTAMFLSFLSLPLAMKMFPSASYGQSIVSKIALTPMALCAAIPAFVFAVAGPLIAPRGGGRPTCFVFSGLALFFSAAGLELTKFADAEGAEPTFWLATLCGILLGAGVGLWFSLEMQKSRGKEPNKSPEPTSGTVTDRTDARSAPVPPVAHL
jgi:nitrate/nitrite transporter NarK